MNIGICTSFYNGYGRYYPDWIKSIRCLTTPPQKITIVLSGNNNGLSVVPDSDINVIRLDTHTNMGNARNIAVKNTDTEYIQYLDIDDTILQDAIDIYAKYEGYDVISGGLRIKGDKANRDLIFNASLERQLLGRHCCCSHAVYRRSLWEQRPYIQHDFCDQPLWCGFAMLGASFIATKEVTTCYNTRKDGHNMQLTDNDRKLAKEMRRVILEGGII